MASSSSGQFTVCGSTPQLFDSYTGSGAILKSQLALSGAAKSHTSPDANGSQSERDIPAKFQTDGQTDSVVKRKVTKRRKV